MTVHDIIDKYNNILDLTRAVENCLAVGIVGWREVEDPLADLAEEEARLETEMEVEYAKQRSRQR